MRALDLKLARDLWWMRGQAFAIALVVAAAMSTFVLSNGVHRSLVETRDAYYERQGFADVFAWHCQKAGRAGTPAASRRG